MEEEGEGGRKGKGGEGRIRDGKDWKERGMEARRE